MSLLLLLITLMYPSLLNKTSQLKKKKPHQPLIYFHFECRSTMMVFKW